MLELQFVNKPPSNKPKLQEMMKTYFKLDWRLYLEYSFHMMEKESLENEVFVACVR